MSTSRAKPLAGVRVLDLTRLLPGPMATLHLADLGADVIRIEPVSTSKSDEPESISDATRTVGYIRELLLNRSKRALLLDLKQARGREIFLRLARTAQVIVEGFRPGVVDRLGIGYDSVLHVNSSIVYCSISGYGQTGPDRLRAGHDINYLASTGVGDQIGVRGGPPAIPNLQMADILGGSLTAIMGILAALLDAHKSGQSRYIDVSMTDSILAHSVMSLAGFLAVGRSPTRGTDVLSGDRPGYNYYSSSDGRYFAVGALESKFWNALCDALDRPDLKSKYDVTGDEALQVRRELQSIFGSRDSSYWSAKLHHVDCCVNLVLNFEEVLNSPQVRAREMIVPIEDSLTGKVPRFAFPLKMSDFDPSFEPRQTTCSAETDGILECLGYGSDEIVEFRSARIVG